MRAACVLALALWVHLGTFELQAAERALDLVAGQQKVLQAPGVSRIAVADPNVADVKVVGSGEVLVTAVGSGKTELTIWRGQRITKYQVNVTRMDPRELRDEVKKLLGDRENIRTRIVRDKVYIEGQVLTLQDLEKAEEVAKLFPQVQNMVKLDPAAHAQIAQAVNRQLERAGLNNARASVVGSTVFLEGTVNSKADMKKAELITDSIGQNIHNVLRIGASRMVELDVEFVEVARNSLDEIGIRWPTNISGDITFDYSRTDVLRGELPDRELLNTEARMSTSLGTALQFNDGITRVLARPRLVTASSEEASFLAGGEIPIPIVTQERAYVEYKEYGIRLNITPVVDSGGNIQTRILTEISDIDESVSIRGIPGFLSRRVDTEVTVRDGDTIVLSGLLHVRDGKDVSKVPILGHIPIIGELFKSRRFRERKTELVVFVTPRLVDPVSEHLQELSNEMLRRYRDAEDDVDYSLFD